MYDNTTSPLPPDDPNLMWCQNAVQEVSRTFALTVDVLGEPMSTHISISYLVCRIADTIEDAGHVPLAERARLLRLYDAALDTTHDTTAETFRREAIEWSSEDAGDDAEAADWNWRVVAKSPRVLRTFDALPEDARAAITPPARQLVQGIAQFTDRAEETGGLRVQSIEELERYCHYAAGTIGTLITNLLVDSVPDRTGHNLYKRAECFGLLLQLVNIAKDVRKDLEEENAVYLPAEWLAQENVPQEEILAVYHRDGTKRVIRRLARHAMELLDDAEAYLETMPLRDGNTLAAWGVPYVLAVATLRELLDRPADALSGQGVKVQREEVFAVVSTLRDTTDRTLPGELRTVVQREPLHHSEYSLRG